MRITKAQMATSISHHRPSRDPDRQIKFTGMLLLAGVINLVAAAFWLLYAIVSWKQ